MEGCNKHQEKGKVGALIYRVVSSSGQRRQVSLSIRSSLVA